MNPLRILLLTCLPILTLSSPAFGSIIVTFGTSTPSPIFEGGSGTIDVFARSTSTDTLDGFLLDVSLTGGGGLIFSAVQTESQLTDSNYVFFGRSNAEITSTVVGTVVSPTSYVGFDLSDDGSGPPPLPGASFPFTLTTTDKLIYRLNLTGVTAGTYTIDATPSPTSDFFDPTFASIPFTSIAGSITVAAAVPEPGSMLFCGVIAVCAGARRWRKKRTSQSSCV